MNFFQMTDDEFINYLKEKYGANWLLVSLTVEEFRRFPTISKEEMEEALEEGRKQAQAFYDEHKYTRYR